MANSPSGCGTRLFLLVWVTFWCSITFLFDGLVLHGLYQQWQSLSFLPHPGTVLESRVEVHSDSDGTSRTAKIRYQYQLNGNTYQSDTITLGTFGMHDAGKLVSQYPANQPCQVFYDPDAPQRSVLRRGIQATDLFTVIFLTPFNAVGITILAWLIPLDRLPMGPHSIGHRQEMLQHRFAISQWFGWQSAVIGAGAAGFVMTFVTFLTIWLLPGWLAISLAFATIGLAAVLAYVFTGSTVVQIDPLEKEISVTIDGKTTSTRFLNGLQYREAEQTLTLLNPGNEVSPLPSLRFYSDVAKHWFRKELDTLLNQTNDLH